MAGLDRFFVVLKLFDEDKSEWTVQEIASALDTPVATVYRAVRELVKARFLESAVDARYRLGPAFIEFDRRIRRTDPLLRSGSVFLDTLVEQIRVPCTAVLARLYGDQVMCVADAQAPGLEIQTSYERGRPMPLLRGATSKAILARMPASKLDRLLSDVPSQGAGEPARENLEEELRATRQSGFSLTFGEVDPELMGVAAPVGNKQLGIRASLSVILRQDDFTEERKPQVLALLLSTARLIDGYMAQAGDGRRKPADPLTE